MLICSSLRILHITVVELAFIIMHLRDMRKESMTLAADRRWDSFLMNTAQLLLLDIFKASYGPIILYCPLVLNLLKQNNQ